MQRKLEVQLRHLASNLHHVRGLTHTPHIAMHTSSVKSIQVNAQNEKGQKSQTY